AADDRAVAGDDREGVHARRDVPVQERRDAEHGRRRVAEELRLVRDAEVDARAGVRRHRDRRLRAGGALGLLRGLFALLFGVFLGVLAALLALLLGLFLALAHRLDVDRDEARAVVGEVAARVDPGAAEAPEQEAETAD